MKKQLKDNATWWILFMADWCLNVAQRFGLRAAILRCPLTELCCDSCHLRSRIRRYTACPSRLFPSILMCLQNILKKIDCCSYDLSLEFIISFPFTEMLALNIMSSCSHKNIQLIREGRTAFTCTCSYTVFYLIS